jgi:hypothetical protein
MNFEETSRLVEESILRLKVDPAKTRGDSKGKWTIYIDSAAIWLDVFNFESKPGEYFFQVMSPLFEVSEQNQKDIETDLLEFAHGLYGTTICKKDNWYYVFHLRETEGLVQSEVNRAIDRVGFYSNDIYSKFKFKYAKDIK